MTINLPADVRFIIQKINEAGHEAFAVGGCVRDSLLNAEPKDWDIATSMLPHGVQALFKRTFGTGLSHGTVTVVLNRVNYEVTTYRLDGEYFDSRRPSSVTFTRNIEDDLSRRDFTINAMAYNDERGLIDLYGGAKDLAQKTIRAVGEPPRRFAEDALRMLRAVRFAAQLGFTVEEKTFAAILRLKENLKNISAERVREELVKLLLSSYPQTGALLDAAGIMPYVLRGRAYGGNLAQALINVAQCPQHTAMRTALFFYWAGGEAEDLLRALRFDNKTIKETTEYIRRMKQAIKPERYAVKKVLAEMPAEWFFNLLTLKEIGEGVQTARAELSLARAIAQDIMASGECVRVSDLKINGGDLMAAGVPKGKAVGDALRYLLDEAYKNPGINEKEKLLACIFHR